MLDQVQAFILKMSGKRFPQNFGNYREKPTVPSHFNYNSSTVQGHGNSFSQFSNAGNYPMHRPMKAPPPKTYQQPVEDFSDDDEWLSDDSDDQTYMNDNILRRPNRHQHGHWPESQSSHQPPIPPRSPSSAMANDNTYLPIDNTRNGEIGRGIIQTQHPTPFSFPSRPPFTPNRPDRAPAPLPNQARFQPPPPRPLQEDEEDVYEPPVVDPKRAYQPTQRPIVPSPQPSPSSSLKSSSKPPPMRRSFEKGNFSRDGSLNSIGSSGSSDTGDNSSARVPIVITPRPRPQPKLNNSADMFRMDRVTISDKKMPPIKPPTSAPVTGRPSQILRQVEDQSWFQNIPRDQAQGLLKLQPEGCFIVRPGRSTPYSLTVLARNKLFNLRVRQRKDGQYALGNEKPHELSFPSVIELVEHHMQSPLVLAEGEGSVKLVCI
ncbi:B-cell linker protein-like isoform X6 [Clavelina lepadiformis]|uniref:B-cell linker protein-like isoform X6 n=1 Tax=Clavelina lepadiformis TaxID=159417 RepID=UPI0040415A1E